jgi:glucose/mannose transport system substrate-binding protein
MSFRFGLLLSAALFASSVPAFAQDKVEVLHFWTSGGEAIAVKTLVAALAEGGVTWVDAPTANASFKQVLRTRVASGNPPGAAQMSMTDVKPWVQAGLLVDVNKAAAEEDWDKVLSPTIVASIKQNGNYYAVPMGVHGTDWLWYNKKIFDRLGLTPPTTLAEFKVVAEKLKAAGIIPLALGGQDWQEGKLFEDIVLAIGGPEFYRKALLEQDETALRSDTMVKVFDEFRSFNNYVDPNYPGRDWNVAAQMVISGQAGMQLMGDYVKAEFADAGLKPNQDYGCVLAPGANGAFLITVDTFAFFKSPKPAEHQAQELMAKILMEKNVQLAFSAKKGSIPPRLDVTPTSLDSCGQAAYQYRAEATKNNTVLPSISDDEGVSPEIDGVYLQVIESFFENPHMTSQQAIDQLVSGLKSLN